MREDFYARHLRKSHEDYEDNLLLATVHSIGARSVITYDRQLLDRFPALCMMPREAFERFSQD